MQNLKKRLIIWAIGIISILAIPFIAMQFQIKFYDPGSGYEMINWSVSDFLILGLALSSIAIIYEFLIRKMKLTTYRIASAIGLFSMLLLFWVNGAVGIIGSENNPANLLYLTVFISIIIGSIISKLKPQGMSMTMFVAAIFQFLVPLFALFIWPAQANYYDKGVLGVFVFNLIFVAIFAISALLFRRSQVLPHL